MKRLARLLADLHYRGFDQSTHAKHARHCHVQCSQCAAAVINGVPAHEHGCPNDTRECIGCAERIPMNQKYCEDCG